MRLVKRAWRMGYRGLAAALAVAWDTMLSPVDVRALTRAQLRGDAQGSLFAVARAKTGKAAIGTLSRRTNRLLDTYSATLPSNLLLSAPIFCTRGASRDARADVRGRRCHTRPTPWATISARCVEKSFPATSAS